MRRTRSHRREERRVARNASYDMTAMTRRWAHHYDYCMDQPWATPEGCEAEVMKAAGEDMAARDRRGMLTQGWSSAWESGVIDRVLPSWLSKKWRR